MHLLIENSAAHVGSSIGSADREAQNFTLVVAFKSKEIERFVGVATCSRNSKV